MVGLLGRQLRSTVGEKGYRYPSKPAELFGDTSITVGYHYGQSIAGLLGPPPRSTAGE